MSIQSLFLSFLLSLVVTECVELFVAWIIGLRRKSGFFLVFIASVITNPALVLLYTVFLLYIGPSFASIAIYFMEIIVVLIEALIYANAPGMLEPEKDFFYGRGLDLPVAKNVRMGYALLVSLILNVSSYLVGLLF